MRPGRHLGVPAPQLIWNTFVSIQDCESNVVTPCGILSSAVFGQGHHPLLMTPRDGSLFTGFGRYPDETGSRKTKNPSPLGREAIPRFHPTLSKDLHLLTSEADNGAEPELDTETGAESAYPIPIR